MITIDGGTGIIRHNGVEVASEKMVDEWRTNSSQDQGSGAVVVASNWERNDNNFALIGQGMTESSGVFSFPTTGIYLIRAAINFYSSGAASYMGCLIDASTDSGSSYSVIANNYASTANNTYYTNATAQAVFDVTNVSTHKVRMKTNMPGTNSLLGSDYQRTCMHFSRIGNT